MNTTHEVRDSRMAEERAERVIRGRSEGDWRVVREGTERE